ncbi:ferredoxin reductase [Mycolicibacter heraklionensis]|nr:ferredoxin reductase [Mycolicibacter heraklionensis]
MFTQTLTRRVLGSSLVDLLTGPHGVDRYTELVSPTWTQNDARARVVAVRRSTPRSVTLLLEPNDAFPGFKAGQHVNLSVDIDGRRRTRCYSPASAEGQRLLELTIGRHESGLVSEYLYRNAEPGMVVGLDGVGGDFILPAIRPRRILLISGGSGITPVMSMLRTLQAEQYAGRVTFIHYARTREEACYHDELAAMPRVQVLHGYTRSPEHDGSARLDGGEAKLGPSHEHGDLQGYFSAEHLQAAMPHPDAVYVCGPPALVAAVREQCPEAVSESFVPPEFDVPSEPSGGRVTFLGSTVSVVDDGRPLLEQAETAGLTPASGCRMGICHSCTCRKTGGTVRNLITGAVSSAEGEDIQICVSVPVGDVEIDL